MGTWICQLTLLVSHSLSEECSTRWLKNDLSFPGISMEGDEELLADIEVNVSPKRDEWMTTLPPERKVRLYLILSMILIILMLVGGIYLVKLVLMMGFLNL